MQDQGDTVTVDKVIRYYNESEDGYRDVWNLDNSHQLNLGLWEKGTKDLKTAMRNLNDRIAEISEMQAGKKVLDIGCGVGGSAIYLCEKTQGDFTGLNINSRQIELAQKYAEGSPASDRIQFLQGDYHYLPFEDESFDYVIAIETLCHAHDLNRVFSEVFRVLKKEGRFVFAETLRSKLNLSAKEEFVLYDRAFMGCQVNYLYHPDEIKELLDSVSLKAEDVQDWSALVWPSVRRLKRISYLSKIYNFWKQRITGASFNEYKRGNTLLAAGLQPAMKKELWGYYMVQAIKE